MVAGILVSATYLLAALGSTLLPAADRRGVWLPLHLALAGGASTAIAAVMPFFVAAFAAVPPADARLRSAAVALVAGGAGLVVAGMTGANGAIAVMGGIAYVTGVAATGLAVLRPVGGALGPSRGLVTWAYVLALVDVAVGATLATLLFAGWPPVAAAWANVKPAHAWLNLVGFVSLVIATTLLHFFPTVVGARIVARRSAGAAVLGIGGGASMAAAGSLLGWDALLAAGALTVAGGALALALNAAQTWRTRGRWTTDRGWHRFAMGGLGSAIAWFLAGVAIAAGRSLLPGAAATGWSTTVVAGPLVAGWMGLAVLASATHLLPAVGPGSPGAHARQRRLLGRAATARLTLLDGGCLLLSLGVSGGVDPAAQLGTILMAAGTFATVGLLVGAVILGLRNRERVQH